MPSTPRLDSTGSALDATHELPIGTAVLVTKYGVPQWRNVGLVVVARHDRNGTYRLRFVESESFVTVHADEVEPA